MKQRPPAFQFYPRQWMGDKAVLAMDWDAQAMHLWLMGIAWQSTPPCCIPNEEQLIRMWLKNPTDETWKRVWPQIVRGWKIRGVFLKQNGLARELKKIKKFSEKQKVNAQKGWSNRRKSPDAMAYATAKIWHPSGNARAGYALQSSSSPPGEEEERKKKEERLARPAPLGGASATRENGTTTALMIENDDDDHLLPGDFLTIGWRSSRIPSNQFEWDHLERSLNDQDQLKSKVRERLYLEDQAVPR